ncbi:serine/threonine-protein kinase [Micromonospora humidisoli]|uniref:non-specific serine/threonine protein kinase n=1 Tax=Micromonospora humidisoli TaxID=2807622 RepID=A0ABS2J369_9ACTN|nr:serine/threonine-protein kinase [Micromonospora humidisoli]MBM7081005.1 serine/threonine protein kinase [Micromonospora humidisoli]
MSDVPSQLVADRYRLLSPLGQGGMGRVWKARDEVLHRDVAIKELVPPPSLTDDERREMRERSLREARAIARLNHVNVVRIFDVLRTDGDPWIVMEYVASKSLQDTLAEDGPVPPARAVEIGLGVLGALKAAHKAGVMHRDVKPGNVLLGTDGRVVLTDFGLATIPGDPNVTRTGMVLGSPAYIAPERARDGTAGPEADLWSLGATLYAAVEGKSPYARPSAIGTLAALATEPLPPARNAGPLKPVLTGLLRKDPTERITAEVAERMLRRAAGKRARGISLLDGVRRPGPNGPREPRTPVVPAPRPAQGGTGAKTSSSLAAAAGAATGTAAAKAAAAKAAADSAANDSDATRVTAGGATTTGGAAEPTVVTGASTVGADATAVVPAGVDAGPTTKVTPPAGADAAPPGPADSADAPATGAEAGSAAEDAGSTGEAVAPADADAAPTSMIDPPVRAGREDPPPPANPTAVLDAPVSPPAGAAGVAPVPVYDGTPPDHKRRNLLIGALVAVLLVGLALAVPLLTRSDDPENGTPQGADPTSAAASSAAPTSAPAAPPPTSAAPSPTPSASPSTDPNALPEGWEMYQGPTFSVPVPKGWRRSVRSDAVVITEPNGVRELFIQWTSSPLKDAVADWKSKEPDRRNFVSNYQYIDIKACGGYRTCADWDWLETRDNTRIHVRNRGFVTATNRGYAIRWEVAAKDWNANLDNFALITSRFVPDRRN